MAKAESQARAKKGPTGVQGPSLRLNLGMNEEWSDRLFTPLPPPPSLIISYLFCTLSYSDQSRIPHARQQIASRLGGGECTDPIEYL